MLGMMFSIVNSSWLNRPVVIMFLHSCGVSLIWWSISVGTQPKWLEVKNSLVEEECRLILLVGVAFVDYVFVCKQPWVTVIFGA